jgi:hypothetical protein
MAIVSLGIFTVITLNVVGASGIPIDILNNLFELSLECMGAVLVPVVRSVEFSSNDKGVS